MGSILPFLYFINIVFCDDCCSLNLWNDPNRLVNNMLIKLKSIQEEVNCDSQKKPKLIYQVETRVIEKTQPNNSTICMLCFSILKTLDDLVDKLESRNSKLLYYINQDFLPTDLLVKIIKNSEKCDKNLEFEAGNFYKFPMEIIFDGPIKLKLKTDNNALRYQINRIRTANGYFKLSALENIDQFKRLFKAKLLQLQSLKGIDSLEPWRNLVEAPPKNKFSVVKKYYQSENESVDSANELLHADDADVAAHDIIKEGFNKAHDIEKEASKLQIVSKSKLSTPSPDLEKSEVSGQNIRILSDNNTNVENNSLTPSISVKDIKDKENVVTVISEIKAINEHIDSKKNKIIPVSSKLDDFNKKENSMSNQNNESGLDEIHDKNIRVNKIESLEVSKIDNNKVEFVNKNNIIIDDYNNIKINDKNCIEIASMTNNNEDAAINNNEDAIIDNTKLGPIGNIVLEINQNSNVRPANKEQGSSNNNQLNNFKTHIDNKKKSYRFLPIVLIILLLSLIIIIGIYIDKNKLLD